jgi:uncharacterized membrane protein
MASQWLSKFCWAFGNGDGTFHAHVSYTFTTLDVPGSSLTRAHGVNFRGDIVGLFNNNGGHGFLRHNGTYTTIDFPGATFTSARGINSSGTITGGYVDPTG